MGIKSGDDKGCVCVCVFVERKKEKKGRKERERHRDRMIGWKQMRKRMNK